MPLDFTIRPFDNSDRDYAAVAAFQNAYFPEHPKTVQEMRDQDTRRAAKLKTGRFMAQTPSSEIIGAGRYGQSPWNYDPHRFEVLVMTAPEKQKAGVGSALHAHVLESLAPLAPQKLSCSAREDMTQSVSFAVKQGYKEEMRDWESKLTVADFDAGLWQAARQKTAESGITIRSRADLASDPDRDQKIWQAEMKIGRDVPSPDPFAALAFDEYEAEVLLDPHHLPDAFFVAVDNATGDYVGVSTLWKRGSDNDLDTGLTGVLRLHRRKGIALALKLCAIAFAKQYGAEFVRTDNASTNEGMLSINNALGFVRQPAWIYYAKVP